MQFDRESGMRRAIQDARPLFCPLGRTGRSSKRKVLDGSVGGCAAALAAASTGSNSSNLDVYNSFQQCTLRGYENMDLCSFVDDDSFGNRPRAKVEKEVLAAMDAWKQATLKRMAPRSKAPASGYYLQPSSGAVQTKAEVIKAATAEKTTTRPSSLPKRR